MGRLADLWTSTIGAEDYANFLYDLHTTVAEGSPPAYYFWKSYAQVTYGGYPEQPAREPLFNARASRCSRDSIDGCSRRVSRELGLIQATPMTNECVRVPHIFEASTPSMGSVPASCLHTTHDDATAGAKHILQHLETATAASPSLQDHVFIAPHQATAQSFGAGTGMGASDALGSGSEGMESGAARTCSSHVGGTGASHTRRASFSGLGAQVKESHEYREWVPPTRVQWTAGGGSWESDGAAKAYLARRRLAASLAAHTPDTADDTKASAKGKGGISRLVINAPGLDAAPPLASSPADPPPRLPQVSPTRRMSHSHAARPDHSKEGDHLSPLLPALCQRSAQAMISSPPVPRTRRASLPPRLHPSHPWETPPTGTLEFAHALAVAQSLETSKLSAYRDK